MFAVKIPIGTMICGLIGIVAILFRRKLDGMSAAAFVLLPGAALFLLACSQTGFGHSLRYALPACPFLYLTCTAAVSSKRTAPIRVLSRYAMCLAFASSLSVYPHSLSYFNEPAGGPSNGHFHLLDGNVEWGQDLFFVHDWLSAHPDLHPVYVALWSWHPKRELGVRFNDVPNLENHDCPPGHYVISVNYLRGEYRRRMPNLEIFLNREPVRQIAYSANVYYVP